MNTEEDPEDFILLNSSLDLVQTVMLFFSAEAAFQVVSQFVCLARVDFSV
jgi:hypothetical protein